MPTHEVASVVVESKDERYPVGSRAIVIPNYRKPDGSLGTGGAVEYIDQTHEKIIKLPDWGELEDWLMLQHSGTVLYSAKHWGNIFGKKIAVLGIAFKPETDDIRDSVSVKLVSRLVKLGAKIIIHDPKAIENARKIVANQIERKERLKFADDIIQNEKKKG